MERNKNADMREENNMHHTVNNPTHRRRGMCRSTKSTLSVASNSLLTTGKIYFPSDLNVLPFPNLKLQSLAIGPFTTCLSSISSYSKYASSQVFSKLRSLLLLLWPDSALCYCLCGWNGMILEWDTAAMSINYMCV